MKPRPKDIEERLKRSAAATGKPQWTQLERETGLTQQSLRRTWEKMQGSTPPAADSALSQALPEHELLWRLVQRAYQLSMEGGDIASVQATRMLPELLERYKAAKPKAATPSELPEEEYRQLLRSDLEQWPDQDLALAYEVYAARYSLPALLDIHARKTG